MRRAIISIFVLAILALPASVAANRSYSNSDLAISLKAYKNQIKQLSLGKISLQCDEGKTHTRETATLVFRLDPAKQVKKNRKFHVLADKTLSYPIVDPITLELVGVERDKFKVDVNGRFNKRYTKATGSLRFTGSFRGPDPNAQIEGELIQYHNCDSGIIGFTAPRRQ
jgi:hypothetical protein